MNNAHKLVKELLIVNPRLRDDDELLWFSVCEEIYMRQTGNVLSCGAFAFLSYVRRENNLPTFGAVTRCRRKLQANHPELRGKLWEKRHAKEAEYKEYARSIEEE